MSRALTADMITAIIASSVSPIFLASIGTLGGTIYVWSGVGSITWNGNVYLGVSNFGGVTAVEEASDLTATTVQFSLNGVNDAYLTIALSMIRQGYNATLWIGALNSSYALIADPYQLFKGLTDVPECNESGDTTTIVISAESRIVNLSRPRERRYTTQDQQIDDPTDVGFDFVPSLQDAIIVFGGN